MIRKGIKAMLTIEKLKVSYKDTLALKIDSQIHFQEGDKIGVIGSNGAGKTTLIKALLGLVPYTGKINSSISPQEMVVHLQENNYVATVSVKIIIESILAIKIKDNKEIQELIQFFNFEDCLKKRFKQLSGGQQQRLTIILVLMQDSPLTFFDEVTSGLDFETRQHLMEKINQWYMNKKATLVIVSHYYDELEILANKLLILEKGQVVDFGDKSDLFQKYCGASTIIVDNNIENKQLLSSFRQITAPEHLLAYSCLNKEEEIEIVKTCVEQEINFKRSNNDIEIMTMNAKHQGGFYEQKK